jgi:hypothetical protein
MSNLINSPAAAAAWGEEQYLIRYVHNINAVSESYDIVTAQPLGSILESQTAAPGTKD